MLYAILSKLPKPLDIEALISRSITLFSAHPPSTLPFNAWRAVSAHSVLKTTRDPVALARQTLGDGERELERHSREIEREEQRRKMVLRMRELVRRYRRPAGAVTLAVLVGVLSFWLGTGQDGAVQGVMGVLRQRIWNVFGRIVAMRG